MATLHLDSHDRALLDRPDRPRILSVDGRRFTVSSASGGAPHQVYANPNGRIACSCMAGTHGARCSHAALVNAFLRYLAVAA